MQQIHKNQKEENSHIIQNKTIKPQKEKQKWKERNKEEIQKQLEKMFKMAINAYL